MSDQPIDHPSSNDRPPAANQPSSADDPDNGAPRPTGDRHGSRDDTADHTDGAGDTTEDDAAD